MPVAKETGKDFLPVPAGTHIARNIGVISLGTQPDDRYPVSFKVMLMFEIPGETIKIEDKDAPMVISRQYTLSLSEKANLRHDLESWRGRQFTADELKGFEVSNVLGAPCMLSVIHKANAQGKVFANVSGISGVPKGVTCPPAFHKLLKYEVEQGMDETFKALPEWIQTRIKACEEWTHPAAGQAAPVMPEPPGEVAAGVEEEDSMPF